MKTNWLLSSCAMMALLIIGVTSSASAQESPRSKRAEKTKKPSRGALPLNTASATTTTEANAADAEDIVVTGLRASLASAQNLKRNSDSIVDAIVAEDIGKLPDNNVAEALARVTGVQVNRYNDEANQILVRGLPDVTTTFNGREVFTDQNRNSNIQDFGAGTTAAIEVYKSGTSDLIEPGLAGLVNVRSRRPFDFKGLEIAGALRASYNDQTKHPDPNGNLLIGNRWNTGIGEIGALINVQASRALYRNAVRWGDGYVRTIAGDPNWSGDDITVTTPGVGPDTAFPGGVGLFYSRGTRWRPSVNGSLQWKPASNFEVYVDGLWQAYRSEQANDWFFSSLERDRNGVRPMFSNVVLVEGQPNKIESLTKTGGYPSEMYRSTVNDRVDTYQAAIGMVWDIGRAHIKSDFAYTYSLYQAKEYSFDSRLSVAPTIDVIIDDRGAPNAALSGFDAMDPNSYIWRGYFERRYRSRGDGIQWRGDINLDTDWSFLQVINVGARYSNRTAKIDTGNRYAYAGDFDIPVASLPSGALETVTDGFKSNDLPRFQNWLAPTRNGIQSNFAGLQAASRDVLQRLVARFPQDAGLRENLERFQTAAPAYDPLQGYTADEDTYAVYAQGKYKFALGSIYIDGTFGVRAVNTDGAYSGVSRVVSVAGAVTYEPTTIRQNYLDVLPSIATRIKFTPKLQMRLAYNQTRTRPSFYQLNPALNITRNSQTGAGNPTLYDAFGNGGNPDLVPLTSKNYDATLEWYFGRAGSLTGAVFYRDLYGFISNYTRDVVDPVYGRLQLSRPENAGAGKIKGAEVNFQSFFTFLPGLLSGLGGQANVTYLDGTNRLPATFGGDAPIVPITGVSKWTYNITGFYEKGPFSTRLSYNRRTAWVNSYNRNPGEAQYAGEATRAVARLDYSMSYNFTRDITLTFDMNNILKTPFNNYRNLNADQYYPRDIREEARFYSLGMRFRF